MSVLGAEADAADGVLVLEADVVAVVAAPGVVVEQAATARAVTSSGASM
ncbi:hypothetical protein MM1S1540310_3980 [Mycobacteroides abscessus subsp. bolletii 1S-154-0310]|nr:hypothetical protein MM1S1510930_4424 [Mycobacteroides abscessus subsp. bolletii 1S-151-0930]EIU67955.1 hypothetical protein MM1S1520914_4632 [Mycobacteroides abscessus subsp. bolletii 1S-152-0914]EIU71176.1 hypothetical protein MM1S1530915_3976 [Mycobacteroides abscessus subsp. bolletii 1S-153-0915]EIU80113.1 hypothetical protein MM1S1540310_3980 [Mycobacteroides abscessus subsp. bolletii 1S-154-0310]